MAAFGETGSLCYYGRPTDRKEALMTKHLIDQPASTVQAALPMFLRVERAMKPHDSTKRLITRLRSRTSDRLAAFARIARGRRV